MEALNALINLAEELNLFTPLGPKAIKKRASLYADDMVIFLHPTQQDLCLMRSILEVFAALSGLHTNVHKCQFSLIRCCEEDSSSCQFLPVSTSGVSLQISRPSAIGIQAPKSALQPLVDAVANRLPTWKAGLMNWVGRVALTKSTMVATSVHLAIAMGLPAWVIKALEKLMKGFVWQGTASASGVQCVVAWDKVCRPTDMGGLGIPNIKLQGYALRLRWEWLRRVDPQRNWVDLPDNTEAVVRSVFSLSVTAIAKDSRRILFWKDNWLDGQSVECATPAIFNGVQPRIRAT